MKKGIFIAIVFVLMGAGCAEQEERKMWTAFYYPEGCLACEDDWIIQPMFLSYEECYDWAFDLAKERNFSGEDEFECGTNCRVDYNLGGIHRCDETYDGYLPTAETEEVVETTKAQECFYQTSTVNGDCLLAGHQAPTWAQNSDGFVHCYWNDETPECQEMIIQFCGGFIMINKRIESEMPEGLDDLERYEYFSENGGIDYTGAWAINQQKLICY